ncbi:contractile injection system tape measure protein [Chitinophaga niabensis]|uniref:Uncharacterized protein n=1 Tax=Chitinophaga niabensis TaxID=536979 RepID=A0A1N6HBA9_9BACT|nr:contractile injection system tape measure protein [Chitinophaga niabensis]SIO17050.1 hypothetical protein SAMN04488055_3282 [Chitinophaga niabensis]
MQSHIIHTMKVSLRVPDMENAFPMQQRVKECLGKEWDDQLTAILDKYGTGDQFLQIPRLEVQLEPIPAHQWENHFKERFMEALDKALSRYNQDAKSQTFEEEDRPWGPCSASEQYQDVWLFFMQHGMLPWWAQPGSAEELEQQVIAAVKTQPQFCKEQWTRAWLKGHLSVQRWVQQCSPSLQHAVLEALAGSTVAGMITSLEAKMLLAGSSKVNLRQLQCLYWDVVFQLLLTEEGTAIKSADIVMLMKAHWGKWVSAEMDAAIIERIHGTINDPTEQKDISRSESIDKEGAAPAEGPSPGVVFKTPGSSLPAASKPAASKNIPPKSSSPDLGIGEHLLINDAGLVLLHPFLLHLFKHFEWLQENDTRIDPQYVHRAAHLLAFMVSGEEQTPEYKLVFPKLLCGLPLDTPLEKDVYLTTAEKEQAKELLEVVIKYWDALGSTSADGLRSTFLQREGKLIFQEDQWLLIVTPQTVDILLNRLPWGLGFVKLPWMEQLLKVQWNP